MHIFLPMLRDRFIQLLPDHSSDSVLIQKQVFKIFYAVFQVNDTISDCPRVFGLDVIVLFIDHLKQKLTFSFYLLFVIYLRSTTFPWS